MRLYLSSFRMGDHPEHLVALAGNDTRRGVVIANAMDDASPQVRGSGVELELADAVTRVYGSPPPWDGLALLDEAFVPHYRSPGHPETADIERVVTWYRAEGIAYRALHDGQALLVNGPETKIV